MSPDVAIVVLSLDHWAYTHRALRTLGAAEGVAFETVVVDNGSHPDVVAALRALATTGLGTRIGLRVEANERNVGIASGRNQGAAVTDAPLLLFLDNDVEVTDPRAMATLVRAHRREPRLGAVGAVLLDPPGTGAVQFAGGTVDRRGRVTFAVDLTPHERWAFSSRTTAFCLGACMLTPHATFDAVGGFDAAYDPMDFEDIDYCLRNAEAGRPSAIALDARVVHHGHVTTGRHDFERVQTYLRSGRTFVRRWRHHLPGDDAPRPVLETEEG